MKITMAQLNPFVGDIEGNLSKLIQVLSQQENSDLVAVPELFLVGYPPRDLLERSWFIKKTHQAVQKLQEISLRFPETGILVGIPSPAGQTGKKLHNSAILVYQGTVIFSQHKSLMPTYDVFDEARYFEPAPEINIAYFKGEKLGISICEDAWNKPELWPRGRIYALDPIEILAQKGATLFVNISASPFCIGKEEIRYRLISNHSQRHGIPFIYINQVGGNDELIFDGRSMCFDKKGQPITILPSFVEHIETVDTCAPGTPGLYRPQGKIESAFDALVLGLKDYLRKCGFSKAIVGLSGGIDSAVTCCLAQAALGRENVLGISMPSPYSSRGSVEDSRILAENLGIDFKEIEITPIYKAYLNTLNKHFDEKNTEIGVTEENIQARIRGNILMAFSNKYGHLVLSTGNKSEISVGYCTLYGDMSGGLNLLADVPKTLVYEIARFINRKTEIIPKEIMNKPPSAELRPDQLDQDSLPPYPILDKILHNYIDEQLSVEELIALGFDRETVMWVTHTVDKNEYKRKQAAPGLKVTTKAFGVGRRMPIAAKY
ncbi:NAD+ synthase [Candidatus Contubernalis alkaliaceticus]|uniref:NAD+ synthase n=1 Tax=Candidatus Contubernalis alkaliaceticus TaxID=338645 RepID=UPI001F4C14CF|nr:NAD+ synthase [Candidatus Contubernalis alkalaceticus]UNC93248.1 NAD+ synthase [Candidatus Contubernalis alkalaceticus]